MKRALRRTAFLAFAVVVASGHVGSPDAWYDGPAGPYPILVHVQVPPVVPGIAIVNVRVTTAGVDRVTAFVNKFDATGGTPPPDVAVPVAANPGWYRTQLWVMSPGSNSVTVAVLGAQGDGSVVVPLVAVAARRLGFSGTLAGLLVGIGLFLALGLFTIVGAAVRESVLPPGTEPDANRRRRARFAMARAIAIVALVITGTGAWWRSEDAQFSRNLFRPLASAARVDPTSGARQLVFTITDSVWVHRNDPRRPRARGSSERGDLIEDHGKLVHLFVISTDGRSAFAHLHPTTTDTNTFTSPLPPLPAGTYNVFADIVHTSGLTETMTSTVSVTAPSTVAAPADADDSWAIGGAQTLADGTRLTLARGNTPIVANEEADLRFAIAPPAGQPLALEPYLGMPGHAVVVRDDGKVFIHLHPLGTISVAAQARLSQTPTMAHAAMASDTLYFPYAFPQPGNYTVWVQIKRGGRVMTGSFAVRASLDASPTR